MLRVLGRMLAFEGLCAAALFALGKVAPELKQTAEDAAKARLRETNPEVAEQLEQLQEGIP